MSLFSESQEIGKADELTVISHRDALSNYRSLPILCFVESLDTRLMKQPAVQCLTKTITT